MMNRATPLDLQHVLILGAGAGLGAAIARRFGREGFAVTLVARREQALADLADRLRQTGIVVDTVAADAADPRGFRRILDDLAQRITPGVVVYNAALIARDSILTCDHDYLLSSYAIDVLGAITAAQVFIPAMRRARAGTFLATGGYPGVEPQVAFATLSLGKAGLRAAVSLLHHELAGDGVHVAGVTIGGAIASGTRLDPDRIADTYWALHTQPATDWSAETVFDGR
jgi:short-subunit dehydrogenase